MNEKLKKLLEDACSGILLRRASIIYTSPEEACVVLANDASEEIFVLRIRVVPQKEITGSEVWSANQVLERGGL